MAYETIKIEIDKEVCQQAQQILESHHLTMEQAIQMFFQWVVQNPDGAKAELKCWKDAEKRDENVKLIFDLYLGGQSVIGIIRELEKRKILSPTGKEKWCKRTIDVMLSNEKYTGDVRLLKAGKSEVEYESKKEQKV